jgi:LuxR family maltose regulon positive regulatory protein
VVAAERGVAGGQARAAVEMIRRAREEWSPSPPSWLEVKLAILESRAWTAAGDAPAAVAAAQRAGSGPEAAAALAHARLAAGDELAARRVLGTEAPESLALGVALADARLSYGIGDGARGRRCLERALRLAKPERVRLPFAMERTWLRPVLRRDPDLAGAYHELLEPDMTNPGMVPLQKKLSLPAQATPLVVEQLSAREREVLTHASGMLSTAEIATEMYLSVNTVKTHLRSIYRKLSASHRSEAVRRAQQLQLL